MPKVIIRQLSKNEVEEIGIKSWPIWEKEVSSFDWTYDEDEQCYIIEGEFIVETDDGKYNIKSGDFVTFQRGLSCVWDIKKPVKKYYNFS